MKKPAVRKPARRAVSARLAALQKQRKGIAKHIAILASFPPDQLMAYERGQLRFFRERLNEIDRAIYLMRQGA